MFTHSLKDSSPERIMNLGYGFFIGDRPFYLGSYMFLGLSIMFF